eukprot:snap_masked-scaffold_91-processed-gene-0.21-mRNA-1 protein AED:0.10 eAED:0.11 QI:0/0/0/0.5/1/1/2/0/167
MIKTATQRLVCSRTKQLVPTLSLKTSTNFQLKFIRNHGSSKFNPEKPSVTFYFLEKDGNKTKIQANLGQNLLRVAQANDVELEGACECSVACSTCHVILSDELFDKMEEEFEATEDEEDMLDMAFGLTDTSRLGCQLEITSSFENEVIKLPSATRNFYVDGHVPQPH